MIKKNERRSYVMSKIKEAFQNFTKTTNWDGIRCIIKGDPSIREIMGALKRQKEIDNDDI